MTCDTPQPRRCVFSWFKSQQMPLLANSSCSRECSLWHPYPSEYWKHNTSVHRRHDGQDTAVSLTKGQHSTTWARTPLGRQVNPNVDPYLYMGCRVCAVGGCFNSQETPVHRSWRKGHTGQCGTAGEMVLRWRSWGRQK